MPWKFRVAGHRRQVRVCVTLVDLAGLAIGSAAVLHDVGFLKSLRQLRNKMSKSGLDMQRIPYPNILPAEINSEFDRFVGK